MLALDFKLTYALKEIPYIRQHRTNASLQVSGDCLYRKESRDITKMSLQSKSIEWTDQQGQPVKNCHIFAGVAVLVAESPAIRKTLKHAVS